MGNLIKTMASTVSMNSVILFYSGTIKSYSFYYNYELPQLVRRGIEIIRQLVGD